MQPHGNDGKPRGKVVGRSKDRSRKGKLIPLPLLIVIDIFLIASAMLAYAYFLYLKPQVYETVTAGDQATAETADTSKDSLVTDWSNKFAGKFTNGDVLSSDNMYISDSVNVSLIRVQQDGVTYYIEDIYIADINCFRSAFADGVFARGYTDTILNMALENNAVCAVNGDFYGIDSDGVVIRNGILYNTEMDSDDDVLVLYYDGTMKTYSVDEFDPETAMSEGAWQAWCFGPALLDDSGNAVLSYYDSVGSIEGLNPRTAVGYYEPGHYCFVTVDGRAPGYSVGMTMQQLAQLFQSLGCSVAYNLDGGQSSVMTFGSSVANEPYKGGREVNDILYITDWN